jgi:hypothetical protein
MRRTVLSVLALACTAVLAGTVQPAFADDGPTAKPATDATVAPAQKQREREAATPAPADEQRPATGKDGQVTAVPRGAADTGVATSSSSSSSSDQNALIGGAAALVAAGGAGFLVVRRRRATGA